MKVSAFQDHLRSRIHRQAKLVARGWLAPAGHTSKELSEKLAQVWVLLRNDTTDFQARQQYDLVPVVERSEDHTVSDNSGGQGTSAKPPLAPERLEPLPAIRSTPEPNGILLRNHSGTRPAGHMTSQLQECGARSSPDVPKHPRVNKLRFPSSAPEGHRRGVGGSCIPTCPGVPSGGVRVQQVSYSWYGGCAQEERSHARDGTHWHTGRAWDYSEPRRPRAPEARPGFAERAPEELPDSLSPGARSLMGSLMGIPSSAYGDSLET
ncbi:hypothetical protein BDV93DRAFT_516697 [Ceratobasidium sp. AG-I]|nr:hypothetical protein BDV93DRAFT_516697 [Ceratobasidium sp. AG-I]